MVKKNDDKSNDLFNYYLSNELFSNMKKIKNIF